MLSTSERVLEISKDAPTSTSTWASFDLCDIKSYKVLKVKYVSYIAQSWWFFPLRKLYASSCISLSL